MGGKETGSKQIHPLPGITCLLGQRAQTQGWHEVRPQHQDRLIGSHGGRRTVRTALEKHSSPQTQELAFMATAEVQGEYNWLSVAAKVADSSM